MPRLAENGAAALAARASRPSPGDDEEDARRPFVAHRVGTIAKGNTRAYR
jgi:hypothetical protein